MDIDGYIRALSVLEISDDKEVVLHFDTKTTSPEELGNIVKVTSKALNRNVLAIPCDMCLNSLSIETLELWVDMAKSIISEKKKVQLPKNNKVNKSE